MGPVGTKGETEKHFCIPPKKCLNVPRKWQRQATTTPNFASKCTDTIFLNFALHDDNYYCHREFPKFESSQQRPHSGSTAAKQNQKPPGLGANNTTASPYYYLQHRPPVHRYPSNMLHQHTNTCHTTNPLSFRWSLSLFHIVPTNNI